MKREILFRGKREYNGKWVVGSLLIWSDGSTEICHTHPDNEDELLKVIVYPETVGQFTGLTDKNGKKIFEGDIVELKDFSRGVALNYKQPTSRWVVKWYAETAKFGIDYMQLLPYDFKKSEVIGNIHDNPELLKGGV